MMQFHRILVGSQLGAVTAFCNDPYGNLFGLSAAHVLAGDDGVMTSQDSVRIWGHLGNWNSCGQAFIRTQMGNSPYPHEFGQVDAGLFTINNALSQHLQADIQPLQFSPWLNEQYPRQLRNRKVFGYSVMNDLPLAGRIDGVQVAYPVDGHPIATDLVIGIESGHTNPGDSGMLWLDTHGNALGLHFAGDPGVDSRTSLATFFHRVAASFSHLQLSWGWLGTQMQLPQLM